MSGRSAIFLLAASVVAAGLSTTEAIENVTVVSTTFSFGTPSSAEGYVYENTERTLNAFSTATDTYSVASLANNLFVRRSDAVPNQSSIWYTSSGTGTNLAGMHENNYAGLLLSNSVLFGSDNTFANTGTVGQFGNIERIDLTWNSAITVTDALAFAVFERGAVAVHDGFAIAAITAIDVSGNPTEFGPLLKIAGGWGGATNAIGDMDYRLFRYSNGDDITTTNDSSAIGTQGIGGIVISAADLGLVSGMTVYGYALMGNDVTATNSTELLDWMNSTYYPTTTDSLTGGGGLDLAAFNGFQFAVVPEPVPLAPILLVGAIFAGWNVVRARVRRNARA